MTTNNNAFEVLNQATATSRATYVARAEEIYMHGLFGMRSALLAVGMDLNKVAPYPNSWTMARKQYRMAESLHKRYKASFEDAPGTENKSVMHRLNGKAPWLVVERAEAEAKVRKDAQQDANACFDAFLVKMVRKIACKIVAATLVGRIWDGCRLTVSIEDTHIPSNAPLQQVWNTKCILNQSVYGKLFNQWPTRRVS